MATEESKIGTPEWVKGLSDDSLKEVREVILHLRHSQGMWCDWEFDLEELINSLEDKLDNERPNRVERQLLQQGVITRVRRDHARQ